MRTGGQKILISSSTGVPVVLKKPLAGASSDGGAFYLLITDYITYQMLIKHLEGNGNPLQYSCLENSMDGGAW